MLLISPFSVLDEGLPPSQQEGSIKLKHLTYTYKKEMVTVAVAAMSAESRTDAMHNHPTSHRIEESLLKIGKAHPGCSKTLRRGGYVSSAHEERDVSRRLRSEHDSGAAPCRVRSEFPEWTETIDGRLRRMYL